MKRYIVNRILLAIVSLLGITVTVFIITQVLPGNTARTEAGPYATAAQLHAMKVKLGLDKSIVAQFWDYFKNLFHFNFGLSSQTGQSVEHELMQRLPASLELSLGALIVAVVIGLCVGVFSARFAGRLPDTVARVFTVFSSSVAIFWIGLLAALLFCNTLHILPSPIGRLPSQYNPPPHHTGFYTIDALIAGQFSTFWGAIQQLALPCLVLGLIASPAITKSVRSQTVRALESDYARTARHFGYSQRSILFRDGLRNSLLPVLTNVGLVVGYLLGGNVIVEQIFSWPGIGQYADQALGAHDLNALRGYALIVGTAYVVINMVLDILYTVVDPRIEVGPVTA